MFFFRSLWNVAVVVGVICAVVCDGRTVDFGLEERQNGSGGVRREWSSLSVRERIEYIDAVKCLMRKPSRLPAMYNSDSLFNDFLAVHVNHTWEIHLNGYFLGYHRGFVRIYEDALQTVCGYRGRQPFCHWPKYLGRPLGQSPVFDGSPSSFGSDGGPSDTATDELQGGSCVARGPFSQHRVAFGTGLSLLDAETGHVPDQRAWVRSNDCLRRRLDDRLAHQVANQSVINAAIAAPHIDDFRRVMDPTALGFEGYGFHSGTHSMVGGHMRDLFIAPADPVFYCLHAQLDKTWMAWQARNKADRVFGPGAVSGPKTLLDAPESQEVSLDDMLNFGRLTPLGKDKSLREMMDPSARWLGYSYA